MVSPPLERPELRQWLRNYGRAGWKASKYSLLYSAHFKETRFEEDVSQRLVGQDPQKHRRRRVL